MARNKRQNDPEFRLHDYYGFNTTEFVNEGVISVGKERFHTTGELTVWDAFKIGNLETARAFGKNIKRLCQLGTKVTKSATYRG
jgi:hypothetical protein